MKRLAFVLTTFVLVSWSSIANAAELFRLPPDNPKPAEKYLFYLHGIEVELHGPDRFSKNFGKTYEYTKIIKEFTSRGYNVISEVRVKGTKPLKYAVGIAAQIERLLEAGVPGKNIAVVGHSRGAFMALIIRIRVHDPNVSIVAMAGCAKKGTNSVAGTNPRAGYETMLRKRANELSGRLLSIYDRIDKWFGTCREAFTLASDLKAKEIVINGGEGHAEFYDPDPIWVNPVIEWIGWK